MTGDLLNRHCDEARDDRDCWASLGGVLTGVVDRIAFAFDGEDTDGLVAAQCESACNEPYADQEKIRSAFKKALPLCESPIERVVLPWLIGLRHQFFDYDPKVLLPGEGDQLKDNQIAVVPQLPIGRYRVDFALAGRMSGGRTRFVVIECDGAAFHDSVDQVKRDIDREVRIELNPHVLGVVRLSGKEIVRDPRAAAAKVKKAVFDLWSKPRSAHGI